MIRCLIVDDSPTIRATLREILAGAPGLEVVGEAADGASAVERTVELSPDVVTLDIRMPRQDGFEAIRQIMERAPTPILVIGADADDANSGISFRALQLGAVEVLGKPRGETKAAFASHARAVVEAVRAVAGVKVIRRHAVRPAVPPPTVACIGIAASTGGPMALRALFSALPADFAVPILVVQHIAEGFSQGLVRWLADETPLCIKLAEHGELPTPGTVYLAPSDRHLMLSMGRIRLDSGEAVRGHRPSGSLLFASLARELGARAAGVLLTGMGDDGVTGLSALRAQGGFTVVQGPESCTVYGMPHAALEAGAAGQVLELGELPAMLLQLAGAPARPVAGGRRKLLLVDDSESILAFERELLGGAHELHVAHNGKEALRAAATLKPDAVLMDLDMPVMRGDEALERFRQQPEYRRLPIILITSEKSAALRRRCWELGCTALLEKPIDPKRLLETLSVHLG